MTIKRTKSRRMPKPRQPKRKERGSSSDSRVRSASTPELPASSSGFKAQINDEALMLDPAGDPVERASAISRLAADNRTGLIPDLRRLLRDEEPYVRLGSAIALFHYWGRVDLLDEVIVQLHHSGYSSDAEWKRHAEYREKLMPYLGLMASRLGDATEKRRVLALLIRQLGAKDDELVRRGAYVGLLEACRIRRPDEQVTSMFEAARNTDWVRLARALSHEPELVATLSAVREQVTGPDDRAP